MYNVAEIELPFNAGVFYTCRTDDRVPTEVVADGISGLKHGADSDIYHALDQYKTCQVRNIFTGLSEAEAKAKQKTLIEYARIIGRKVLNVKQ
jgi:hypothetical protein